jgi:hypothetical protein
MSLSIYVNEKFGKRVKEKTSCSAEEEVAGSIKSDLA